jgi:hypothetical protein
MEFRRKKDASKHLGISKNKLNIMVDEILP